MPSTDRNLFFATTLVNDPATTFAKPDDLETNSLVFGFKWVPNTNREIKFSFVDTQSFFQTDYSDYNEPGAITNPTDDFKNAVRDALGHYESIIDITFVEVEESATSNGALRFGITSNMDGPAWAIPPWPDYYASGDIWFN